MEDSKYQKQWQIYQKRLKRFLAHDYMPEMNITSRLVCRRGTQGIHVSKWSPPSAAASGERPPTFAEARQAEYESVTVGVQFGPSWSTHWFKVVVEEDQLPFSLDNDNIYFHWQTEAEGLVWTSTGHAVHGLSPQDRSNFPYSLVRERNPTLDDANGSGGRCAVFYIEVACNGLFGNGRDNLISPPNLGRQFRLEGFEMREYDPAALKLFYDLQILDEMTRTWGEGSAMGKRALYTANQIINAFHLIPGGGATIDSCQEIANAFLRAASVPGSAVGMTVTAVGNCHIDTAWLWRYGETRRKTARSWASQLALMDRHPQYVFVASQMQQLAWLRDDYPELFSRIQAAYRTGRFLPVGGSWVEMDGNLPSGESFVRQFLYGQKFVAQHFDGLTNDTFWLPGTVLVGPADRND